MYTETNPACCAIDDIFELGNHTGSPENAMKEFCQSIRRYGGDLNPTAFYMFSGVEECRDEEDGEDWEDNVGYASEFAAYIKKHRLGVVMASPKRLNRQNHPTHLDQVWIWAPSLKNLKAWWKEHGGK